MPAGIYEHDSMFSVRDAPWHGLGAVLPEPPKSIDDAIEASGLSWNVKQGDVYVVKTPRWTDDFGNVHPTEYIQAKGFRANVREDTEDVLGIVSEDYKVVPNRDAFKFLDALIGTDVAWETAGSLLNGRRVWVLVRLPEYVEIAGDNTGIYVYVANSHDGSMAVTAAITPVRIVCQNTLGLALRRSEGSPRTYKFRHTGDLQLKYDEARKVLGMTLNYAKRFKEAGDQLATERFVAPQMQRVLVDLIPIDTDKMTARQIRNRKETRDTVMSIFRGEVPGKEETVGNAPNTKWCAVNSIAEWYQWYRRTTIHTDQVRRSFEDGDMTQKGYDLVTAA